MTGNGVRQELPSSVDRAAWIPGEQLRRADIGEIPAGWSVKRLDEVADLVSGGTPSKLRPEWWQGSIPWASPKDMKRLRLRDTQDHISDEGLQNGSRLAPAGAIFVVIRGMILAKELPVAMAAVPMAFNQDMKALVPRPAVDADYLLYAIASRKNALTKEIGTSAHGTRRLGTSSLEQLSLPLPPKEEQRAIATVLSIIHAALEIQDGSVTRLQQLKAAVMAKLFREGLRGEPLKQTQLGEIPESWATPPLGDVVELAQYGLSIRGETNGRYAMTDEVFRAFRLRDGDLLFNRTNSLELVGRTAVFHGQREAVFASYLIRLRVKSDSINPDFLNYYLNLESTQAALKTLATRGVSQSNISATKLKLVPVPLPALSEQEDVAAALDALSSRHRAALGHRDALRELFSSVLHLLMTGQVRVSPEMVSTNQGQTAPGASQTPDPRIIQAIVSRIVQVVAPERVFLFGEAAPGSPSARHGVGLLVVAPFEARSLAKAVEIEREVRPEVLLELLVRRPEEVSRALRSADPFIKGIVERGRLMHAATVRSPRSVPARPARQGTVSEGILREMVQRIVEVAAPRKIILFGSAARGEMGPDSDIDLLVVTETDRPRETAHRIRERLLGIPPGIPKDVIVVTPDHFERHKDTIGFIFRAAVREGRVLHVA